MAEQLPRNVDAERAVIGAAVTVGRIEGKAEMVRKEHFSDEVLGEVWEAMLRLHSRHDPLDIVSVPAALRGSGRITEAEAITLLTQAAATVPSSEHSEKYAELVLTTFAKRRLAVAISRIARIAYGDGLFDPAQVFSHAVYEIERESEGVPSSDRDIWTAAELADLVIPDNPWLLDNLLIEGGLNLLAGDYRSGKTFAAIDLALAIAGDAGSAWGRRVESGGVLYLGADNGRNDLIRRIRQLAAGRGMPPPHEEFVVDLSTLDLGDPSGRAVLEAELREYGPKLLIVDALVRYIGRLDENAAGDVGSLMAYFRRLCNRYGVTVLLIHHLRKLGRERDQATVRQPERIRGSGDLIGAPDSILLLTYETTAGGDPMRMLSHIKCREAPERSPVSMEIATDDRGGLVLSFEMASGDAGFETMAELAAGLMLEALQAQAGRPFSTSELDDVVEAQLGAKRTTCVRARKVLRQIPGVVVQKGSGRGGPMEWIWSEMLGEEGADDGV